jgi:ribonuclease J
MTIPQRPSDKDDNGRSLHWHLLGGNNKSRIGMNSGLCVYEETDSMGQKQTRNILFDIGNMSADPRRPEDPALTDCDTVIPDMSSFLRKVDDPTHKPSNPLDAIFLTHNHSDHIAALPMLVLMGYELPKIYATPYTAKRLEQELAGAGLDPSEWPPIVTIAPGKPVQEGPVKVSAFWVSHSTPQSVGFFIETPEGNILTPGDFKMDQSVIWGPAFNEEQFKRIIDGKNIDLMLLDSTGADRDIVPTTEEDVRESLRGLMEEHPNKRFVIAVMSGFEENVASVAKVAAEYDRTVWVAGWSHEQSLSALQQTGLTLSDSIGEKVDVRVLGTGKSIREMGEAKPKNSVVIVTGAQGSPGAALTRAADGHHSALQLDPKKDIILFCAPVIPGQEGQHARLMASLRNKGMTVLTRKDAVLYSQAHARLPELIEMANLAKAKVVMPVHGDTKLRNACNDAMNKIGQKTFMADNGDVLRVTKRSVKSVDPETKGQPKLVGFKTLQGATWTDRHYLMKTAPQERKPDQPEPVNNNTKRRPKIFNVNPKN